MLNYIWVFMIFISFIFSIANGKIELLSSSIFEGTSDAINIIILSLGAMSFWSGIMEIASSCGVTKKISNFIYPLLKFLFPEYSNNEKVLQPVCMNIISNMLGLGNAGTPFGLKAIKEMQNSNKIKDKANDSMIMFIIINTACLQIVPTFLAVLRKNHGSSNPFDILIPSWITSFCALIFGIIINKIISNINKIKIKNKDNLDQKFIKNIKIYSKN